MQKIVLFIEPSDAVFETPFKIGHLFMNGWIHTLLREIVKCQNFGNLTS